MHWQIKAGLQRILAGIPGGKSLYYLGQRLFGRLRQFSVKSRLPYAQRMVAALDQAGFCLEGKRAVEIGTGWAPVLPLYFWLRGLETCHTYDLTRFLRPSLVIRSANQLVQCRASPFSQNITSPGFQERIYRLGEYLKRNPSSDQVLQFCDIHYYAPTNAAKTSLEDCSIDLVFSNLVLGDIPLENLCALLDESQRILKPGGLALHIIDLNDQFSHGDPSLSPINFLRFSEQEFSKYNSVICYQNRLRAPDYSRLFNEYGYRNIHWEVKVDKRALEMLKDLPLHPDFRHYSPEELCTSSVMVLAQKIE